MRNYNGEGKQPSIFIKYTGTHEKLIYGNEYSIIDLAKAYGMSYQVAYNRLRGKKEAKDSYFQALNPKRELWVEFVGKHKDLKTGKLYTLKQLGKVCGISGNAMYQRVGGRPVCTLNDLRGRQIYVTKKTPDNASTHWLRRKLV